MLPRSGRNLSKPNSSLIASAASASVSAHVTVSADEIATDDVHGAGAPAANDGLPPPFVVQSYSTHSPVHAPSCAFAKTSSCHRAFCSHRCSRNLASSSSSSSASSSSSDWNADAACARSVSSIRTRLGDDAATHSSHESSHPL